MDIESPIEGETRINPRNGNAMVKVGYDPLSQRYQVTDIFGGHQMTVDKQDWVRWEVVSGGH